MKILTLPVNKAAFDMLADANPETRKGQEYRAISIHWYNIFIRKGFREKGLTFNWYGKHIESLRNVSETECNTFDAVKFTNGYGHKVPSVVREWKGLTIGKPNPLWVPKGFLDLDKDYFRIELGEIIN